MAVSSTFNPGSGALTTTGDNLDNTITTSRDATGSILINAGAVPIQGGTATVTNTGLIQAFGQDGNDTISLDETNGAFAVRQDVWRARQRYSHRRLGRGPACSTAAVSSIREPAPPRRRCGLLTPRL
jgi:hypothetical protein